MTLNEYADKIDKEEGMTGEFMVRGRYQLFHDTYDMNGWHVNELMEDYDDIGVISTEQTRKNTKRCEPYDWVAMHWFASDKDGNVLEGSKVFSHQYPVIF